MIAVLHRLRQVDFIVNDLGNGTSLYDSYLGMKTVRHSQGTDGERAVLHAGDGTFVRLWHPNLGEAESSAFRESRGQGPYRLVFETKDLRYAARQSPKSQSAPQRRVPSTRQADCGN